jgi:hypothetical protein
MIKTPRLAAKLRASSGKSFETGAMTLQIGNPLFFRVKLVKKVAVSRSA